VIQKLRNLRNGIEVAGGQGRQNGGYIQKKFAQNQLFKTFAQIITHVNKISRMKK